MESRSGDFDQLSLTVLVVTHNSERTLATCLERLAYVCFSEWMLGSISVLDNASEDQTSSILEDWQIAMPTDRFTVTYSRKNVGWGAGNNLASGTFPESEYYLICNPDASIAEND